MRQQPPGLNGSDDAAVQDYQAELIRGASTAGKWLHSGLATDAHDAVAAQCIAGQSSFVSHPVFFVERWDTT
jgi:hypothetical protein